MIPAMSMNRKQRRLQEKQKAKTLSSEKPARLSDVEKADHMKAKGMALKNAGKEGEAVPFLKEALALDPSAADAHFALAMMARTKPELGVEMEEVNKIIKDKKSLSYSYQDILFILKKRKQYEEARICQEELCRLAPEDLDEQGNLAISLNMIGRKEDALKIFANLMNRDPHNKIYKALFINTCGPIESLGFDPLIKKALQICFDNIYEANLKRAYMPWISTITHDPACAELIKAETKRAESDFISWIESTQPSDKRFLTERLFLDGLRLLIISDPCLEQFLIRTRRWLCLNLESLAAQNMLEFYEPFLFALGEQCFLNEYIYPQTDEETSALEKLHKKIIDLDLKNIPLQQAYALVSCYSPIYQDFPDKKDNFDELSRQSEGFSKLAKTQFFDVIEEKQIKESLKSFGTLENKISRNVQNQYEENPYPRWVSVTNYPTPNDNIPCDDSKRYNPWDILIAGCGTGRQALSAAGAYPNGKVTAIDISRASLAYAKRKAIEADLADRIDFIHADILNMDKWSSPFDIIECSGVLHHMEDPFKGWQILVDILKDGGYFKIGLYSELARDQVIKIRNYVKEKKYPHTLEGIRACRKDILDLPPRDPLREYFTKSDDFYATSSIRDLIFHVQEHRMTLPQIKVEMDKMGLSCLSVAITELNTMKRFDKMFPQDVRRKNLENWHIFEQKFPYTFTGMYQFWCQKTG